MQTTSKLKSWAAEAVSNWRAEKAAQEHLKATRERDDRSPEFGSRWTRPELFPITAVEEADVDFYTIRETPRRRF